MEDDSVAYTIKQTLPPDLEYRFLKMLDKWASYINNRQHHGKASWLRDTEESERELHVLAVRERYG